MAGNTHRKTNRSLNTGNTKSNKPPQKHKLPIWTKAFFAVTAFLTLSACGSRFQSLSDTESGNNSLTNLPGTPSTEAQTPASGSTSSPQKMILNQAMWIRSPVNAVLESVFELPVGTQIEVPADYEIKNLNYRTSSGSIEWSSTGFLNPLKILSAPSHATNLLPPSKIAELNQSSSRLYISASIVGASQGVSGSFNVLTKGPPTSGFLKYYAESGRPGFSFLTSVNKRFSARLNRGVDASALPAADFIKWQSIYFELKNAADRTVATPKSLLMIDSAAANKWSVDYEKIGVVSPNGAWTIATEATAVRHGFENVPCAEFMSEMVREAYQRAGYRASDDFNDVKGNPLIWSNSAAVVAFSSALYTAGWIPWDPKIYKPIAGALLMHGAGQSPGHTYISAGADGRFIVDNGYPQGRDLGKASEATIEMMYQTGVFFLPPGINPPTW